MDLAQLVDRWPRQRVLKQRLPWFVHVHARESKLFALRAYDRHDNVDFETVSVISRCRHSEVCGFSYEEEQIGSLTQF